MSNPFVKILVPDPRGDVVTSVLLGDLHKYRPYKVLTSRAELPEFLTDDQEAIFAAASGTAPPAPEVPAEPPKRKRGRPAKRVDPGKD